MNIVLKEFFISNRKIGEEQPTFIIAELSANHMQNLDIAIKTLKAAKRVGADAFKISTEKPETLTIDCKNEYFMIKGGTLWDGETLFELYQKTWFSWEDHYELKKIAEDLDIIFFSTPTDITSVDFLEEVGVPAYKVASFEITDIPFIEYIASKKKPVLISTGIAELEDIEEAINACKRMGNEQIAILKCTSLYPAPLEELNLKTITDLKNRFDVVIGLSDHSRELIVPIASVALGAKIIERHFTLDRKLGGPDAEFSMEPLEFEEMVNSVRKVEKSLGKVDYSLSAAIMQNRLFARSLFVVKDIKKGEILTKENIKSIRPGYGLHPKHLKTVLGKIIKVDTKKGTPLSWELLE